MSNSEDKINKFYWCRLTPDGKSVPFYFFDENKDTGLFYTFPSTNRQPNPLSYENGYFSHKDSFIQLDRCREISSKLVEEKNLFENLGSLNQSKYNALLKKLLVNNNFKYYPDQVKKKINTDLKDVLYTSSDILFNSSTKTYIIASFHEGKYKCVRFSYLPRKGYARSSIDGYDCYIDIRNPFYLSDLSNYRLFNVSNALINIGNPKNAYFSDKTLDTRCPVNLPFGSVLTTSINGIEYIYIKCSQDKDKIVYFVGKKGMKIEEYRYCYFPINKDFDYTFRRINGKERMKYILSKH